MSFFHWHGEDLILALHVQTRASRDEWGEDFDGRLKIRITAAPVEGQANEHLRKVLAHWFGVAPSQVTLLNGAHGRNKRCCIKAPRKIPFALPTTN
jgi:uncharacterized protein